MKLFKNKIFIIVCSLIAISIFVNSIRGFLNNKNIFNIGVVTVEGTILESKEIVETLNSFYEKTTPILNRIRYDIIGFNFKQN